MAVLVKYCDFTTSDGVIGTSYQLQGLGYLDSSGVLNYFLAGGIDMDDSTSMVTFFETYVDGVIKYTKTDDVLEVILRKSKYRFVELGFTYIDNDGIPQTGSIYFTRTGCRYISDLDVVKGCTDSEATNYDSTATEDDGSCTYTPLSTDDILRKNANIYNLDKSNIELIDGARPCCCSLTIGRFVNRAVEISQRIANNQVELSPEVLATAVLDFAEFDLGTLTNGMNIEVVVVLADGSTVVLTNFYGNLFGMGLTTFLTLVALNINLDSPDFSCVYPGSGSIINIIAAPDYGASINLAEVNINFVDYLDLGTSVDTGQVFLPGKPAYFGGKAFIPDCNNFGRLYVADPTGASAIVELNHSLASFAITGTNTPASTAWCAAMPHEGYRSYKRVRYTPSLSLASPTSRSYTICKDSLSSFEGVIFYVDPATISLTAIHPDGTIDTCPTALPFSPETIKARRNFGNPAKIFICETDSQRYGSVEYAGIGLWTITDYGTDAVLNTTNSCGDIEYNASIDSFFVSVGSSITRFDSTGANTGGTSFAGNNEVLTVDPLTGMIYCSCANTAALVGSVTINKLNPLTAASGGTAITLAFAVTGKIGVKTAALIGDVRYYMCEYNTNVVHVLDGNFTQVDTITVQSKTLGTRRLRGCIYDNTNGLLIVKDSIVPRDSGTSRVADVVIDPVTKVIQNVLYPTGSTDIASDKGINMDIHLGIYAYIDSSENLAIWNFLDRSTILGQIILSSNPYYLYHWDILSDLSIAEGAFEALIDDAVFGYHYGIYNGILEKLLIRGGVLPNIAYISNNYTGYMSDFDSAATYLLTTDNGTEDISTITDIVVNGANGKFAVLGTSNPTAVGLAVFTNTTFVYLDCVPELDTSILTAGFNTDTGELWVLGVNAGLKRIAIYDTSLVLVSAFNISTGVGGTFELIFDPQNNVMFLHHQGIGKVYIYQQDGVLTSTLNVTTKYPTLVGPNISLRYYANGVSYGLIYESGSEEVHFFPILLVPSGPYTNIGIFDDGRDAILTTEDDECLTFEEKESLVEKARQLIINCNLNE